MSGRIALGMVVGVLILAGIVSGSLGISHGEELSPDEAVVDSTISWETVVSQVPKVAGYEVEKDISIRGKGGGQVTITLDSPLLWIFSRWVSEGDPRIPGEYRDFQVWIGFYESEAALQEDIKVIPLGGYEVQEDQNQVFTGFFEGTCLSMLGREDPLVQAFAAKRRLWVRFTVYTDVEGDPFAGRQELQELTSLVAERLVNT